jgi:hypothetical protein
MDQIVSEPSPQAAMGAPPAIAVEGLTQALCSLKMWEQQQRHSKTSPAGTRQMYIALHPQQLMLTSTSSHIDSVIVIQL